MIISIPEIKKNLSKSFHESNRFKANARIKMRKNSMNLKAEVLEKAWKKSAKPTLGLSLLILVFVSAFF